MNCLYCDKKIDKKTLKSHFFKEDVLCFECREKLRPNKRTFKAADYKVTYFFDYDDLFKTILIQYKECFDEALKDVFIYDLEEYLKIRYFNYQILYVPSSKTKQDERGFNHLKLIFEKLNLKEVVGLSQIEEMSQVNKNLKEREKMIDNYKYEGKRIKRLLIVDDVYTSGSTIKGVMKEMCKHADKIAIIVLSKTLN